MNWREGKSREWIGMDFPDPKGIRFSPPALEFLRADREPGPANPLQAGTAPRPDAVLRGQRRLHRRKHIRAACPGARR